MMERFAVRSEGRLPRLDSLTGLRFVAAFAVIVNHSAYGSDWRLTHLSGLAWIATPGTLGVPFFFALSGFVLTWSARRDDSARNFYKRRFARVYPLHLVTWVVTLLALLAAGQPVNTSGAILGLVLLQSWVPNPFVWTAVNGVSWSLSCEVFFYALTPLLLPRLVGAPRKARTVGLAAFGVMTVTALLQRHGLTPFTRTGDLWVFPPWSVGFFLIGMALAVTLRDGQRSRVPPWIGLVGAAASYVALAYLFDRWPTWFGHRMPQTYTGLLFVPALVVLLRATATADLAGRGSRWLARPSMVRLGEWSFALYLVHPIVLRALVKVLHLQPQGTVPSLIVETGFVLLAILAAAVSYYVIERPLEFRLRPKRNGVRATAIVPAPALR
jgi:peptidoglycan/LPS O-acetylase OafA/YrhL